MELTVFLDDSLTVKKIQDMETTGVKKSVIGAQEGCKGLKGVTSALGIASKRFLTWVHHGM